MSRVITFYSYKGGVGRTFVMANIAALLAMKHHKVLMIDMDLEAPGLHDYFSQYSKKPAIKPGGIVSLLLEASNNEDANWEPYVEEITLNSLKVHFLSSGIDSIGFFDYFNKLSTFSWDDFVSKNKGGGIIEKWRSEWLDLFDFILIDSRTGITEVGGICTVLLPDILVMVYVSNLQSFDNVLKIAKGIFDSRKGESINRQETLGILPLLNRFHRSEEHLESDKWLDYIADETAFIYDTWDLSDNRPTPRRIVEATYIPYHAYYTFGEQLPVLSDSLTEPGLPNSQLVTLVRLLTSNFRDIESIIDHQFLPQPVKVDDVVAKIRSILQQAFIDTTELDRLLSLLERQCADSPIYGQLLYESGVALCQQQHFALAESYLNRAHEWHTGQYGPNDPLVAKDLEQLAVLFESIGRYTEAVATLRQALAVHEYHFGSAHPDSVPLLERLAETLISLRQFSEAEQLFRQILRMDEHRYGRADPTVSRSLNNLALLLEEIAKDLDAQSASKGPTLLFQAAELRLEARRLLERAVDIDKHHFSPRHPSVAADYNNLAQALQATGNVREAERCLRLALEIDEKNPKRDDAAISRRNNNLGSVLLGSGQPPAAEIFFRRALLMDEKTFGLTHPQVAIRLNNLAAWQRQAGQLEAAAKSLRRALGILLKHAQGRGHSPAQLATVMANYIDVLRKMDKDMEGIKHAIVTASQEAGYDDELFLDLRRQILRISEDISPN